MAQRKGGRRPQPRDRRGRFTSTGGRPGGGKGWRTHDPDAVTDEGGQPAPAKAKTAAKKAAAKPKKRPATKKQKRAARRKKVAARAAEGAKRADRGADRAATNAARSVTRRFLRWFKKEPLF